MTLDDKIALVRGANRRKHPFKGNVGYAPANPRLGNPALRLADGHAGVESQAKDVTLLPAPIAAAASWDTSMLNEYGRVIYFTYRNCWWVLAWTERVKSQSPFMPEWNEQDAFEMLNIHGIEFESLAATRRVAPR
jgi:hypothetical protein